MAADDDPSAGPGELAALSARAREWIAGDPDPVTRAQLTAAVEAGDLAELRAALADPLTFGTAGLRGPVGAGPARMNRAAVIRITAGLARHVRRTAGDEREVVVGHDARPDSQRFARDVVAVLVAAGLPVAAFGAPVPTPLVAHAARVRAAAAAVVVTASHNPPADNGYKVYGPDAIQIVAPDDAAIAAAAAQVPPASEVPRADLDDTRAVTWLGGEQAARYLDDVLAARPATDGPPPRIAYTPLHGVAGALALRALQAAGFNDVHVVASQQDPDGSFPTVASPNPQEPGALDAAVALAAEVGADLVLANDPDGDRLAVAVADGDGGHRTLTGDQVGVLLGDHLLRRGGVARPVVVSSIVSSPMLADVAAAHGARHEVTLTGFKWICRAAAAVARDEGRRVLFGYEEALGYAVGDAVRDKDGIGAAVATADLARELADDGRTLLDRLDELYRRHGLWVSHQVGVALAGADAASRVTRALDAAGAATGARLGPRRVVSVDDHRRPRPQPPWRGPADLVELRLDGGGRALLRPSGTEPKVKVYVDLRAGHDGRPAAREPELLAQAGQVAADLLDVTRLR